MGNNQFQPIIVTESRHGLTRLWSGVAAVLGAGALVFLGLMPNEADTPHRAAYAPSGIDLSNTTRARPLAEAPPLASLPDESIGADLTGFVDAPASLYDLPVHQGRFVFSEKIADYYDARGGHMPRHVHDAAMALLETPMDNARAMGVHLAALENMFARVYQQTGDRDAQLLAALALHEVAKIDPHNPNVIFARAHYALEGSYRDLFGDYTIDYSGIESDLHAAREGVLVDAAKSGNDNLQWQLTANALLRRLHADTNGEYGESRVSFRLTGGPQIARWGLNLSPAQ